MPYDVEVFHMAGKSRSQAIAQALFEGLHEVGVSRVKSPSRTYRRPRAKVAAFYGFQGELPRIMREYREDGRKVVFVDLGYWGRRAEGRFSGYHKVSLNDRHPTSYVMRTARAPDRLRTLNVHAKPWRRGGGYILLAGMSAKSAASYGFTAEQWERGTLEKIRAHTDRPVVYRPKPSWRGTKGIPGVTMHGADTPLASSLQGAHAVVTHHSNVAIDGLCEGIPSFCWDGAAVPMSSQEISDIENPLMPEGREQWLANLAYCQWSVPEMRSGAMWKHLISEGLLG